MWRLVGRCVRRLLRVTSLANGSGASGKRRLSRGDSSGRASKRPRAEVACSLEHAVVQQLLQSGHLAGPGLAALCCLSRSFRQACEGEVLWQMACLHRWPSLTCPEAETHIRASGGYRRFYRLQFSLGGELQLNVASNHVPEFIANLLVLLDLSFRDKPVFSCHLEAADLDVVPTKEGWAYRLPDTNLGVVLQGGKGSTRRSIAQACKGLRMEGMAFRRTDSCVGHLMRSPPIGFTLVGRSMYATFRSAFVLPGIFQVTRLTLEAIVTLVTRPKEGGMQGQEGGARDVEFDVLLGALGFEVKVDFVASESRRHNRMDTWQELKWK